MSLFNQKAEPFLKEYLRPEQEEYLKNAGFKTPEDYYDIPYVGLCQMKGLNPKAATEVLYEIAHYISIPRETDLDFSDEEVQEDDDMEYNLAKNVMCDVDRTYLTVEKMLNDAGYFGEEIARMTIRQIFGLQHISLDTLEALADTVWLSYISRFCLSLSPSDEAMPKEWVEYILKPLREVKRAYDEAHDKELDLILCLEECYIDLDSPVQFQKYKHFILQDMLTDFLQFDIGGEPSEATLMAMLFDNPTKPSDLTIKFTDRTDLLAHKNVLYKTRRPEE